MMSVFLQMMQKKVGLPGQPGCAVVIFCLCLAFALPAFAAPPTKLGDLNGDGVLNVFDLTVLRQHIRQVTPVAENLKPFADVNGDGFLNEDDAVALINTIVEKDAVKVLPLASIRETSPFAGEGGVALTREVILRFTMPLSVNASLTTWDANTQIPGDLYAEAGGRKLLTRVELSGDRTKATLFFLEPVPASTRVTVTFDGVGINDLLERQIDPTGDNLGASAGVSTFTYDTAPITPVPGTGIIGHVYASERAAGQTTDTPLAGVLVRVVGSEDLFTYTAADGSFNLTPCPAGRFFVEVDGRTSPASAFPGGDYYPFVAKAWEALPGRPDNLATGTGKIYLPRVHGSSFKAVSATTNTLITPPPEVLAQNPAMNGVQLDVPANSLSSDDGTRGGKIVIAPVQPDRIPEALPIGLNFPQVITVQTDGATNFDRPVAVRFPNLPDPVTGKTLRGGEKSALWSFNHDTGLWEFVGPMTVSDDSLHVLSDVGVGIRQPGWHGAMPGVPAGPEPPQRCPEPAAAGSSMPSAARAPTACCGGSAIAAAQETETPKTGGMCPWPDGCKNPPPADDGDAGERLYRRFFRCLQKRVCEGTHTHPDGSPTFPKFIMDELASQGWKASSATVGSTGSDFVDSFYGTTFIGGQHIYAELYPTFFKYAEMLGQYDDYEQRFDQWDDEHEDFLDNITEPCAIDADLPAPKAYGKYIAFTGRRIRKEAQNWVRLKKLFEFSPLRAGRSVQRSVASSDSPIEIQTFGNLQVTASMQSGFHIGNSVQLTVKRAGPGGVLTDITGSGSGTLYAAIAPPEYASASKEGLIMLKAAGTAFAEATTSFGFIVLNGADSALVIVQASDFDADGDGLVDSYERRVTLPITQPNDRQSDADGDGITDHDEAAFGLSPTHIDTDGDGLSDFTELTLGTGDRNPIHLRLLPVEGELRYAVRLFGTDTILRGTMRGAMFHENVVLSFGQKIEFVVFDPGTGATARNFAMASTQPHPLRIPQVILSSNGVPDSDGDGLNDDAEFVVGTGVNSFDSDGDGISDGVEVANGSNPLDGMAATTGVFSTTDTLGHATDVVAEDAIAVVADGAEGISIFNVENAFNPVRTTQLRFSGTSNSVALSAPFAAVTGSSLALLDLSDLSAVRVIKQLSLGGSLRAVTAAGGIAYAGLDGGQIVAVDMAAGAELERVKVTNDTIHDVAFAGDVLYVLTQARLHAVEITPALRVAGSIAINGTTGAGGRRLRLFAGGGLAYAAFMSGYNVISLADPLQPTLLQTVDTQQRGWKHIVANGSGLGLAAVSPNSTNDGPHDVSLYDLRPNGTGSQFLTTFVTPGLAEAVSIYNGLAYVADGEAGLTVVNYKAYDALGVPPTIGISTSFATAAEGLQAEEGKLGRVTAAVADDVQVRNVEFYVDSRLAVTDGNFPFEHRFTTPLLAPGKTSFTLRARATDTGGNSTWSDTLTVNLVADATPPRVVKFLPPTGSFTGSTRSIAATFSEPIDQATLTPASFAITGAGPDGIFGNADDLTPAGGAISFREASNTAFVTFPQDLAPSLYRLVVSPPIADLAGNQIAAPAQTQFRVFSFTDSDGDGIPDDVEPLLGLNPNSPDTDGDGLRDGDEDFDNDRLTNAQEIALGLDPRNAYSNGTSTLDGDADPDNDRLSNRREALAGTDANKADTDGDGWNDEAEVTGGSNPLDPKNVPIGLVMSSPSVSIVRVGDLTSGLLANASVIAQPAVFLARTFSDPGSPNGGLGSAAFIATPTVFTSRQVSYAAGPDGNVGSASIVATPTVYVARYDQPSGSTTWLSGAIQAQPSITLARPNSDPNGPNGGLGGASFIAPPGVNILRLDISGLFLAQPPVNVEIQNP